MHLSLQIPNDAMNCLFASVLIQIVLCCSNVVQVPLSLNPFQLNLEFGTTHRVQMCYTSKQV